MPLNKALARAASAAALTMLTILPISAHAQGGQENFKSTAADTGTAAVSTDQQSAQTEGHNGSVSGKGKALDGAAFDISLPATYERCQNTDKMAEYLKSIPAKDTAKLKEFNAFLLDCQKVLNEHIANTKERIAKLKEQARP